MCTHQRYYIKLRQEQRLRPCHTACRLHVPVRLPHAPSRSAHPFCSRVVSLRSHISPASHPSLNLIHCVTQNTPCICQYIPTYSRRRAVTMDTQAHSFAFGKLSLPHPLLCHDPFVIIRLDPCGKLVVRDLAVSVSICAEHKAEMKAR